MNSINVEYTADPVRAHIRNYVTHHGIDFLKDLNYCLLTGLYLIPTFLENLHRKVDHCQ